ncbi:MAG: hypothetical protein WBG95_13400 [Sulfitobacter sp.]
MTDAKSTSPRKAPAASTSDITPKHVGTDTLEQENDNIAKVAFDRAKEAIPSMDGVASDVRDYVSNTTDLDFQAMANDASNFVRRNPGTSLAAAAGVGILLGLLASKRS